MISIFNEDCLQATNKIGAETIDLGIYDPPFGIGESSFENHYKRKSGHVVSGYQEAPEDYLEFSLRWIAEATRVLKPNGSMYIVTGHTNLVDVLISAKENGLHLVNQIIWKYNFGVYAKTKFVTSHYNILYYCKDKKAKFTFNTFCRYGSQEKDANKGSLLYQDLEDVFVINKDFKHGEKKNQNKLPDELIQKLVLYSSNPGDNVCDFFMGNFTTAYVANSLGRNVYGYEINTNIYNHHLPLLAGEEFGHRLGELKHVVNEEPNNRGKAVSEEERAAIRNDFAALLEKGMTKKKANNILQEKYQRGWFGILNIVRD